MLDPTHGFVCPRAQPRGADAAPAAALASRSYGRFLFDGSGSTQPPSGSTSWPGGSRLGSICVVREPGTIRCPRLQLGIRAAADRCGWLSALERGRKDLDGKPTGGRSLTESRRGGALSPASWHRAPCRCRRAMDSVPSSACGYGARSPARAIIDFGRCARRATPPGRRKGAGRRPSTFHRMSSTVAGSAKDLASCDRTAELPAAIAGVRWPSPGRRSCRGS